MADQSVRVTNLPQSDSQVGMDLFRFLRAHYRPGDLQGEFALFDACVAAARGHSYEVPEISR